MYPLSPTFQIQLTVASRLVGLVKLGLEGRSQLKQVNALIILGLDSFYDNYSTLFNMNSIPLITSDWSKTGGSNCVSHVLIPHHPPLNDELNRLTQDPYWCFSSTLLKNSLKRFLADFSIFGMFHYMSHSFEFRRVIQQSKGQKSPSTIPIP